MATTGRREEEALRPGLPLSGRLPPQNAKRRAVSSKYDAHKVKVWLGDNRDHYYILSRFLISRSLTITKIPSTKAVKIALDLKKHLVDHDKLSVSQSELEETLFELMRAKGFGQPYIDCYRTVSEFYALRQPLVIIVCGAPCTGKSTIAQQLAARLNMPNVMQTDAICELMRRTTAGALPSQPPWSRPRFPGGPSRLPNGVPLSCNPGRDVGPRSDTTTTASVIIKDPAFGSSSAASSLEPGSAPPQYTTPAAASPVVATVTEAAALPGEVSPSGAGSAVGAGANSCGLEAAGSGCRTPGSSPRAMLGAASGEQGSSLDAWLVSEFKSECCVVRRALDGDFIKALKDGKPLIVEGSHLDPSSLIADLQDLGIVILPVEPAPSTPLGSQPSGGLSSPPQLQLPGPLIASAAKGLAAGGGAGDAISPTAPRDSNPLSAAIPAPPPQHSPSVDAASQEPGGRSGGDDAASIAPPPVPDTLVGLQRREEAAQRSCAAAAVPGSRVSPRPMSCGSGQAAAAAAAAATLPAAGPSAPPALPRQQPESMSPEAGGLPQTPPSRQHRKHVSWGRNPQCAAGGFGHHGFGAGRGIAGPLKTQEAPQEEEKAQQQHTAPMEAPSALSPQDGVASRSARAQWQVLGGVHAAGGGEGQGGAREESQVSGGEGSGSGPRAGGRVRARHEGPWSGRGVAGRRSQEGLGTEGLAGAGAADGEASWKEQVAPGWSPTHFTAGVVAGAQGGDLEGGVAEEAAGDDGAFDKDEAENGRYESQGELPHPFRSHPPSSLGASSPPPFCGEDGASDGGNYGDADTDGGGGVSGSVSPGHATPPPPPSPPRSPHPLSSPDPSPASSPLPPTDASGLPMRRVQSHPAMTSRTAPAAAADGHDNPSNPVGDLSGELPDEEEQDEGGWAGGIRLRGCGRSDGDRSTGQASPPQRSSSQAGNAGVGSIRRNSGRGPGLLSGPGGERVGLAESAAISASGGPCGPVGRTLDRARSHQTLLASSGLRTGFGTGPGGLQLTTTMSFGRNGSLSSMDLTLFRTSLAGILRSGSVAHGSRLSPSPRLGKRDSIAAARTGSSCGGTPTSSTSTTVVTHAAAAAAAAGPALLTTPKPAASSPKPSSPLSHGAFALRTPGNGNGNGRSQPGASPSSRPAALWAGADGNGGLAKSPLLEKAVSEMVTGGLSTAFEAMTPVRTRRLALGDDAGADDAVAGNQAARRTAVAGAVGLSLPSLGGVGLKSEGPGGSGAAARAGVMSAGEGGGTGAGSSGGGAGSGSSLPPLFVPVVLEMSEADHRLALEDNTAVHRGGGEAAPLVAGGEGGSEAGAMDEWAPPGPEEVLRRAQVLQKYLCSFQAQGMPVIKVRYGNFSEALDILHEYVLVCIQAAMEQLCESRVCECEGMAIGVHLPAADTPIDTAAAAETAASTADSGDIL